uniref:oligosaccharide flippase family protein n=1 Tax=Arsukibacterium sp. TaxID=1977258 RepID=UPI002FD95E39
MDNSVLSKALSGFRWSIALRLSSQLLSWLSTLLVIRWLTQADYGIMSLAEVFVTFAFMFSSFGIAKALVQSDTLSDDVLRQAMGFAIATGIILFIVLFLAAPYIAHYYQQASLVTVLRVLAVIFLLSPWELIAGALLDRDMAFKQKAIVSAWIHVAASIAVIVMAYSGFGVWALVFTMLGQKLCFAIGYTLLAKRIVMPVFALDKVMPLLKFSIYILLADLIWFLTNRLDILAGGKLYSISDIGIYAVAIHLSNLITTKVMPVFKQVAFSAFSRYQRELDKVSYYLKTTLQLACLTSYPLFFGIAAISPLLIPLLLGDKWQGVAIILSLTAISIPLRIQYGLINLTMETQGKGKQVFMLRIAVLLLFAAALLAFSSLGIVGLAYAWLVTSSISLIMATLQAGN